MLVFFLLLFVFVCLFYVLFGFLGVLFSLGFLGGCCFGGRGGDINYRHYPRFDNN